MKSSYIRKLSRNKQAVMQLRDDPDMAELTGKFFVWYSDGQGAEQGKEKLMEKCGQIDKFLKHGEWECFERLGLQKTPEDIFFFLYLQIMESKYNRDDVSFKLTF